MKDEAVSQDRGTDAEITDLLFAVLGLMKHHLIRAVAEIGLTPQQAHALRCLVPGHPLPMRDLATELMCDASTVTGIVDRLEERGLVRRQPATSDRRVKALAVTDAGEAARDRLWERILLEAPHVAGLNAAERVALRDLLRRIVTSTPASSCDPAGPGGRGHHEPDGHHGPSRHHGPAAHEELAGRQGPGAP